MPQPELEPGANPTRGSNESHGAVSGHSIDPSGIREGPLKYVNLDFRLSSLFQSYCSYVMISKFLMMEETGVPGENQRLTQIHWQRSCP